VEGSQAGQIAAAAAGGACSAVISGPAELVMIQQQKHGGGLGETAARLFRERGLAGMYRGVVRNPGSWRCQRMNTGTQAARRPCSCHQPMMQHG